TAYGSHDNFQMSNGIEYGYGNKNLNFKWRHSFTGKLSSLLTLGTDHYDFNVGDGSSITQAYALNYTIGQEFARLDFTQSAGSRHKLAYGLQALRYRISPGTVAPTGEESMILPKTLDKEQALESALYVSDIFTVNEKLTLDAGVRFSLYHYLGPRTVNR